MADPNAPLEDLPEITLPEAPVAGRATHVEDHAALLKAIETLNTGLHEVWLYAGILHGEIYATSGILDRLDDLDQKGTDPIPT